MVRLRLYMRFWALRTENGLEKAKENTKQPDSYEKKSAEKVSWLTEDFPDVCVARARLLSVLNEMTALVKRVNVETEGLISIMFTEGLKKYSNPVDSIKRRKREEPVFNWKTIKTCFEIDSAILSGSCWWCVIRSFIGCSKFTRESSALVALFRSRFAKALDVDRNKSQSASSRERKEQHKASNLKGPKKPTKVSSGSNDDDDVGLF